MIDLLKVIFQSLNLDIPIFIEEATQNTPFPYATFKLEPSVKVVSNREDIPLIIDIWDYDADNPDDTTRLENHWDELYKALKDLRHLDENQLLIFTDPGRGMIPDPDYRRRQIRYTIKRYER